MKNNIETFSIVAGSSQRAIEKLTDIFESSQTAQPDIMQMVSQTAYLGNRAATFARVTDGARVAVSIHTRFQDTFRAAPVADDEAVVVIEATGAALAETFGSTVHEALGLEEGDLFPLTHLEHDMDLPSGVGFLVNRDHMTELVTIARWATLPVKTPILVAEATSPDEAKRARSLMRAAVPPFVRSVVPVIVLTPAERDVANTILNAIDGERAEGVNLPARSAVVVYAGTKRDALQVAGKTPLTSKDSRRLGRALTEAWATMPEMALDITEASLGVDVSALEGMVRHGAQVRAAEEPETQAQPETIDPAEVAKVERELAEAREALATRDAMISDLRRELRKTQYELDRLTGADEQDQPGADLGGSVEPEKVESDPAEPPATSERLAHVRPQGFAGVFAAAREHLPLVVLPDRVESQVAELTAHPKVSSWAARTWAILLTLQDYAEARAAGKPVTSSRSFMEGQSRPLFPPNQLKIGETTMVSTNRKFRAERTFPVPVEVDPSGRVYMEAHARVDAGGKYPAPRLYFHDDTAGTGKIFVGYVGPHLRNFLTT